MKKSLILKLGAGVLVAVLLCGCQMVPSDEELINTTMTNWKAALIAQDLDKIMEAYSEDYESGERDDKDSERESIAYAIEDGSLDDIKVGLENAKTIVIEDKAEVYPVEVTGMEWSVTFDFKLQKEDGTWRIVSAEMHEESY